MDNRLKLYVGCALNNAANSEFVEKINTIKENLKDKYEVMEFLGVEAGTPKDVYKRDIQECVAKCDLMLAFCDYPSLGLGYELGTAIEKLNKPVLAVAYQDSVVSRLILGIDNPKFEFKRYKEVSEISQFLSDFEERYFLISQSL